MRMMSFINDGFSSAGMLRNALERNNKMVGHHFGKRHRRSAKRDPRRAASAGNSWRKGNQVAA